MLLDVHGDPFPRVTIPRVRPEAHARGGSDVEDGGHNCHRGAVVHGQRCDLRQLRRVARDDASSSAYRVSSLVSHCEGVVAVAGDGDFADRVLAADTPTLRTVVVVGEAPAGTVSCGVVAAGEPIDIEAAAGATDPVQLRT